MGKRETAGIRIHEEQFEMNQSPNGTSIVDQLKKAGVEYVVCLPDRATSAIVEAVERDPFFRVIHVCQGSEGVSICRAISYGEKRAALVMGHSGPLNSVNSLAAVASEPQRPLVILIELIEKEEGLRPAESRNFGIRVTKPILDLLQVPHLMVERRGDEEPLASLIESAYSALRPLAIVFGAEVARG